MCHASRYRSAADDGAPHMCRRLPLDHHDTTQRWLEWGPDYAGRRHSVVRYKVTDSRRGKH
jgi:hypothetical protein